MGGAGAGGAPAAVAVQGAVVGVIKPPPDVRVLVDKTAEHVALRGSKFEASLKEKMKGQAKFEFLNPGHPYYRYYVSMVDEFSLKEHLSATGKAAPPEPQAAEASDSKAPNKETGEGDVQRPQEEDDPAASEPASGKDVIVRDARLISAASSLKKKRNRPPPPLRYAVKHPVDTEPPAIVDLIKLTAKYAAVLGEAAFLGQVASREQHNPDFSFLKEGAKNHTYFKTMVSRYTALLDWEDAMRCMKESFGDKMEVLDRAVHRVEWEDRKFAKDREAKAEARAEFLAYNEIDWHDFVLVETIVFDDAQAPKRAHNVSTKVAAAGGAQAEGQRQPEATNAPAPASPSAAADSDADSDIDMDMSDDEEIEVRKDYRPKVQSAPAANTKLILPDGRKLDAKDANEHMRVEMLDPKWKEQHSRFLEKQKVQAFAEKDIGRNLARMAAHRPDVFATDQNAVKRAREEDASALAAPVWDGTAASATALTAAATERRMTRGRGRDAKPAPEIDYKVGPTLPPSSSKRSRKN